MLSCEYCQIFKNTYFEKQLQTVASVHSVSEVEKWEMENIEPHKGDDLVSRIFRSSPSEVLEKILVLDIFSNSKKMLSRKVHHHFEHLWMATSGGSDDKICFSKITDPLNPIGCSFENIRSQNTSFIKKTIWLSEKVKCTVLEKTIIAKFEVIENFYSDLPRINIGWKSNN